MEISNDKSKEKVNIVDITLPQLKKVVNIVMTKCYGKDGYRKSDLIRKVLRKLKCDYSLKAASRVRNQIKTWIISSIEITKFGNVDSKKGILSGDSKRGISSKAQNKSMNLRSSKEPIKIQNLNVNLNLEDNKINKDINEESQMDQNDESDQEREPNNSKKSEDNPNKKSQMNQNDKSDKDSESSNSKKESNSSGSLVSCNCTCACKRKMNTADVVLKHEIIDLTVDDAPMIKIENHDMDQNNKSNKDYVKSNNSINHSGLIKPEIKHEIIDLAIDDDNVHVKTEGTDMDDINAVISQLDNYYTQPSIIVMYI